MKQFSEETQAAFRELFAAIEKQYGPNTEIHWCNSFEGSPEWNRLMEDNIQYCEVEGCTAISANVCHWCDKAICMVHSHPSISDDNRDVLACPACFYDGE
jgi:hypothetical protein